MQSTYPKHLNTWTVYMCWLWSNQDLSSMYNPGQKSWDTFAKTPQIRAFPLHPQYSVDLKGSSHPESLQTLSTLFGGDRGRAVTKTVRYKQSSRLTQDVFHKCAILRVFLPGVPRTFGQVVGIWPCFKNDRFNHRNPL